MTNYESGESEHGPTVGEALLYGGLTAGVSATAGHWVGVYAFLIAIQMCVLGYLWWLLQPLSTTALSACSQALIHAHEMATSLGEPMKDIDFERCKNRDLYEWCRWKNGLRRRLIEKERAGAREEALENIRQAKEAIQAGRPG